MKKLTFISVLITIIVACFAVNAVAEFYVIAVPKGCEGNAEPGDVLFGKIFSNSTEIGAIGTRAPAPVPKTDPSSSIVISSTPVVSLMLFIVFPPPPITRPSCSGSIFKAISWGARGDISFLGSAISVVIVLRI